MKPDIERIEDRFKSLSRRLGTTTAQVDFSTFVLSLIFLRLVDHCYARAVSEASGEGQGTLDKAACRQRGCVFVPERARFSNLNISIPEAVLERLNSAMQLLELENEELRGIHAGKSWQIFSDAVLEMHHVINTTSVDSDGKDLALLFDRCLQQFEPIDIQPSHVVTQHFVRELLIRLVKPARGMSVYDPCAGFGGTLLAAAQYAAGGDVLGSELSLFGQEGEPNARAICKMRLHISGITSADVRAESSLSDPQHLAGGKLQTFDRVVGCPPFWDLMWLSGVDIPDPHNRYSFGVPRSRSYAYLQHMLASTASDGLVAVLVPQGVLFGGRTDGKIRQGIVEADLIEGVIALPPGVISGADVSTAVLVLNKNKPADRKGKTLFIDASQDVVRQGRRKYLSRIDMRRIVDAFDAFKNVERYARVVGLEEIRSNSFNLNVPRYADSSPMGGLVTQYSQYERFTIRDIATQVNKVARSENFEERDNAVYIPVAIGRHPVERADQIPSGHDAYYQVVLNDRARSQGLRVKILENLSE